jgi:hypothetical protein
MLHRLATRLCCVPSLACQHTFLFLQPLATRLCCIASPASQTALLFKFTSYSRCFSVFPSELSPYSAVFLHLFVTLLCCTPSKACLPTNLYCIPSPFQSFATFLTPFFLVTDYLLHSTLLYCIPSPTSRHIVRTLFPYTVLWVLLHKFVTPLFSFPALVCQPFYSIPSSACHNSPLSAFNPILLFIFTGLSSCRTLYPVYPLCHFVFSIPCVLSTLAVSFFPSIVHW